MTTWMKVMFGLLILATIGLLALGPGWYDRTIVDIGNAI